MLKKRFLRLFLAGLLLSGFQNLAFSRQAGTSTEPETCWGAAAYEVCVDSTGNWVPTTTNNAGLGLTSLRWSNVYSVLGNFSGAITASTTLGVNGNTSLGDAASDKVTITGNVINVPGAVQSVRWSTQTISPTSEFILIGSTGAITLLGTPTIATTTATSGQKLILLSTAAVVTLTLDSVTSGTQVEGNAAITITTSTAVEFIFNGALWHKLN